MMRVSTKGRYGLRVVLDIARHQEAGPVSLRDAAARQGLSPKYLWQVLGPLKAAGLVASVRGSRGGYVLARPAREITVREIVAALEGEILLVACTADPAACERSADCVAGELWRELEDGLRQMMEKTTLDKLVEKTKAREQAASLMYSI